MNDAKEKALTAILNARDAQIRALSQYCRQLEESRENLQGELDKQRAKSLHLQSQVKELEATCEKKFFFTSWVRRSTAAAARRLWQTLKRHG